MIWRDAPLLLIAALVSGGLCGCDTIGDSIDSLLEPPAMQMPHGIPSTIPPQDTPELEARAQREREELPQVPQAPDPETYSYLGTVPPKPVLPTQKEIAGQVGDLAQEQAAGAAQIQRQADAADPATLPPVAPKPKTATPPVIADVQAGATPQSASDDQVFSGNANAFLPQSQIERTDRLPADAP